jgi:hypothetical protein
MSLNWLWCLFAGIPFAVVALIGAATLVHDRPGRIGARCDLLGVLLGTVGIAGISGAVPHFTGQAVILPPTAVILLVAFVWWQTRTAGALASPSGIKVPAPMGYFRATVLANAVVFALLVAAGVYHY